MRDGSDRRRVEAAAQEHAGRRAAGHALTYGSVECDAHEAGGVGWRGPCRRAHVARRPVALVFPAAVLEPDALAAFEPADALEERLASPHVTVRDPLDEAAGIRSRPSRGQASERARLGREGEAAGALVQEERPGTELIDS